MKRPGLGRSIEKIEKIDSKSNGKIEETDSRPVKRTKGVKGRESMPESRKWSSWSLEFT